MDREIKKIIEETVNRTLEKITSTSWAERSAAAQEECFKNTEKLLYSYGALSEHINNQKEYMEMAFKNKSTSFVSYSKNKTAPIEVDERLQNRLDSYTRSVEDKRRVDLALKSVQGRKGFDVIRLRYLERKDEASDERYTFEEITEMLAGTGDYAENISEKTVRGYKNAIIKEMSVIIFGSDAI